jgi:hypothetical protein
MPADPADKKGIRGLLFKADEKLAKADAILSDPSHKKTSSMDKPQSFSPEKETTQSTTRKLEFESGQAVVNPDARQTGKTGRTRYNVLSFFMMLFALLAAVLVHGTCYIPFQPAHDAICPLVERFQASSAPVVDGVISSISDATHSLVEFEQDMAVRFEGQVARLQSAYPWMAWKRTPTGKGVLVAMLGVENKYATSALDVLVVAGEMALGAGVALWVVSKLIRLDLQVVKKFASAK